MMAAVKPKRQKLKKVKHAGLTFTVPDKVRFKDLYAAGLLAPTHLEDKEDHAPLDFTSISSREVGRQHSVWAVRFAHLIFLIGKLQSELGNVKHDLKQEEAKWIARHTGKYKTKWEAEKAMGSSKRIAKLRSRVRRGEAALTLYTGLSESYKALMSAASREMSRRADERAQRD